ncbi:ribonuclease H-like domain-containing protein [Tanacetum coccineum]
MPSAQESFVHYESPSPPQTFEYKRLQSPTILMAESPSNKKGNTSGSSKSVNNLQLCNHFSRGSCKFGDRCRYVHDARNRAGSTTRNTNPRHTAINPHPWNAYLSAQRMPHPRPHQPTAFVTPYSYNQSPTHSMSTHQQPAAPHQAQAYTAQHLLQPGQTIPQAASLGLLGPTPATFSSQPTSLPSAFSTMTLQDPTWNMDTGATSHLNSSTRNLSSIFNTRLYSSIHVGDGNSIPVTNTGHSIIHSPYRPLHLNNVLVTPNIIKNLISVRQFTRDNNCTIEFDAFGFSVKDFLTRHILLRCDSSGDLYPVTKPSSSPAAFVSTSSTTWHQRLGHPGDEVLRSLSSRHLISCNKTASSSHICHACQTWQTIVNLPFRAVSSSLIPTLILIYSFRYVDFSY